jgi:hypothetical protein
MKSLSWKDILLVLGLLAAIILAHRYADGATATVVSLVTTLVAGMMRSWAGADSPKDPPLGPMLVLLFAAAASTVSACKVLGPAEQVEIAKTATTLADCHAQGLSTFDVCAREGGADDTCEAEATAVYESCKLDGGL